jgi:hypothetical protein
MGALPGQLSTLTATCRRWTLVDGPKDPIAQLRPCVSHAIVYAVYAIVYAVVYTIVCAVVRYCFRREEEEGFAIDHLDWDIGDTLLFYLPAIDFTHVCPLCYAIVFEEEEKRGSKLTISLRHRPCIHTDVVSTRRPRWIHGTRINL